MKKILVVDDEKSIVKGIKFSLEQDDMHVDAAYDGEEALELAKANHYDMILLDIMLPGHSGLEVCQMIREFSDVPIIMLTAKGEDMDKILGLEYGADDYITKPFNILEVKARMKAIFRRNGKTDPEQKNQKVIETKGLKIDVDSRRVYIDDKEVNLTAKEFELVYLLVSNPNKVYSREQLLKTIWGASYPGDARTVDVHVRRLREKIEQHLPIQNIFIQNGAWDIISTTNKDKKADFLQNHPQRRFPHCFDRACGDLLFLSPDWKVQIDIHLYRLYG